MKTLVTKIEMIILIDKILNQGETGFLKEFAKKACCSVRTLETYLDFMNELLEPSHVMIVKNSKARTYQYSVKGSLQNMWVWKPEE